jgi:hypothetical protein
VVNNIPSLEQNPCDKDKEEKLGSESNDPLENENKVKILKYINFALLQ